MYRVCIRREHVSGVHEYGACIGRACVRCTYMEYMLPVHVYGVRAPAHVSRVHASGPGHVSRVHAFVRGMRRVCVRVWCM